MDEPQTMDEEQFGELMHAVDAFHTSLQKAVEKNSEQLLGILINHEKAMLYMKTVLWGSVCFNVMLLIQLVNKGVI